MGWVGTNAKGSLGWLLPLDAAHHAQSNSVPTPCAVCFYEMYFTNKAIRFFSTPVALKNLIALSTGCTKSVLAVKAEPFAFNLRLLSFIEPKPVTSKYFPFNVVQKLAPLKGFPSIC